MATIKLTKKAIADLKPRASAYAVTDASTERGIGFQVRVFPNGRKVYQVRFRPTPGAPEVLQTIGNVDAMLLDEAREKARAIVREARVDPVAALSATTWDEALTALERKLDGGGAAEIMRTLRRECAGWTGRRVRSITKGDVGVVLNRIEDRGATVQRNRTLTYLRLAFGYFIERQYVTANPADGFKINRRVETPSRRFLAIEELKAVWLAARSLDEGERRAKVWGDLFAILILTGARLSEVAEMTVDELNLSAALWEVPHSRMKAGEAHSVPLSRPALTILSRRAEEAKAAGRTLVFTSNGTAPPSGWSKMKKELDEKLDISAWKIHSIRHGFRTGLARLGVAPHIAELMIAHKPRGIGAVYDHHMYMKERREAADLWAAAVEPDAGRSKRGAAMWAARAKEQALSRARRRAALG